MKIFEGIGLIIYMGIAIILLIKQIKINHDFRLRKMDEKQHSSTTKKNLFLLVILAICFGLFLFTPLKMIII